MEVVIDLNTQIHLICKLGKGAECCKYLAIKTGGFHCMKIDPENKNIIDLNWATTEHIAQGDNCEGIDLIKLNEK